MDLLDAGQDIFKETTESAATTVGEELAGSCPVGWVQSVQSSLLVYTFHSFLSNRK
jgi:hypothetical protein